MPELKIEIIRLKETVPVRGNAAATDDPEWDKKVEDEILQDLENNPWAWCCIQVKASIGEFEASSSLGCCNYCDAEDFKNNSGYYQDMEEEAISNLKATLESAKAASAVLELSIKP
jgi:hypothetical protein